MTDVTDETGLDLAGLHDSLADPALNSIIFLNEVADWFPEAISFASGSPYSGLFSIDDLSRYLHSYRAYLESECELSGGQADELLFQYGRTKGVIHRLIARNLAVDEGIEADPEAIVVTVGCHEAMYLVLRALRARHSDVVLAVAPTYMGLTGTARLVDMPALPVATGELGIDFDDLAGQLKSARRTNLRPRALYVIPDFANPSGITMSLPTRRRLLDVARAEGLLLLEDNPYGLFGDGRRLPTLKALDRHRQVVYLGSFAKTGLPGARVGYLVADQHVSDGRGPGLFADQLAKLKGTLTVNTSPIAQAVIGGKLVENDFSLVTANSRENVIYRRNRRRLLDGLASRFGTDDTISWNSPDGGFFVVVTVPFTVDDTLLEHSARSFGVLWTPMRYFYDGIDGDNQIRLSCSRLTPEQIELGLDRFRDLIHDQRA